MSENKILAMAAHDGLIAALAVSTLNGLVASASHDKFIDFVSSKMCIAPYVSNPLEKKGAQEVEKETQDIKEYSAKNI
ncbi:hypothetical protein Fmac_000777 [Flemingia macrophylla]|uniref:Uncharacterized protein n=1 Tax=Flemingia macrophylla TaxID=520843 RepID=A0ABD1NF76_9FABA